MSRREKTPKRTTSPAPSPGKNSVRSKSGRESGREKPLMPNKSPAPAPGNSSVRSKSAREKPVIPDKSPTPALGKSLVPSKSGNEKPSKPDRRPASTFGQSPVPAFKGHPNETMRATKESKKTNNQDEIKMTKATHQPTRIREGKAAMVQLKETASSTIVRKGDRDSNPEKVLFTTLNLLKMKKTRISESASVVNEVVVLIKDHMNKNTTCFKNVKALNTGSYYENVKISNPDEFDVMFFTPVKRVDIRPFGTDGAFYSVALKREKHSLDRFLQDNTISASEMLTEFRKEVETSVKERKDVQLEKKKKGCPAVTLLINTGKVPISLDIVLSLEVSSSWPTFTSEGFKIENWLGTKMKKELKYKPYYLVPKYEGIGTVEKDGVRAKDAWRISFSHVEKLVLKNHGSLKTCCEAMGTRCCRKDCLKLLKHLLGLLKEDVSSLSKFCSYHAKTTLLHACCTRTQDSQWEAAQLGPCFQQLLGDFERYLKDAKLPNFFIPDQNLLGCGINHDSCQLLAGRIEKERNNGFPIFCKWVETTSISSK